MAKARIVYVVDDKALKALELELKDIQKENKKVEEGFADTNEEIKKGKTNLTDLKGAVAGLGLTALAGAAIKKFIELNAEINKSRKEVAQLTKATGLALDSITAKLRATSKVFDKDFNEILRAANTVSKEFGISMTAALDEINEGFTRGLDVNGEYLETLREYSTFIKEAGLNTRQFNILIQKQAEQGIFSDKGIDAIKEAVLSIREMTPVAREAIKGVGIDTEKMISDIQDGTTTYFEAVQQIATKTAELADPVKTGAILADIFKGAGEDAGSFIFTLGEVGDEFAKVTDEEQKYIDAQNNLLDATERTETALLSLTANTQGLGTSLATFWENIKSGTIRALDEFISTFISAEEQMENFRRAVAGGDKDSLQGALDEMNAELAESEAALAKHIDRFTDNNTEARAMAAGVRELNEKIAIATEKMDELAKAEAAEAAAAALAKAEADKLAKANQAKAKSATDAKDAEKARQEQEKLSAKSLTELKADLLRQENEELSELKDAFAQTAEEKEIQDAKELNDKLVKINKDRLEQVEKDEMAAADLRAERLQFWFDSGVELLQSFTDFQIASVRREVEETELERSRQLEVFAGNKDAEERINIEFDAKQDALREKQKQKEKQSAIISILANSAQAAMKAIALFGPPPSLLGIAALASVGIITAVQSAAVLKLKDGEVGIKGPGNRTSDSIPAMLSVGETVLSADTTDDYYPAIKAIHNREISPDIMNKIAMHQDTQPTIVVNDYDKLAKAVMNQPRNLLTADENGLTGYFLSQGRQVQKKQSKYRMP